MQERRSSVKPLPKAPRAKTNDMPHWSKCGRVRLRMVRILQDGSPIDGSGETADHWKEEFCPRLAVSCDLTFMKPNRGVWGNAIYLFWLARSLECH